MRSDRSSIHFIQIEFVFLLSPSLFFLYVFFRPLLVSNRGWNRCRVNRVIGVTSNQSLNVMCRTQPSLVNWLRARKRKKVSLTTSVCSSRYVYYRREKVKTVTVLQLEVNIIFVIP